MQGLSISIIYRRRLIKAYSTIRGMSIDNLCNGKSISVPLKIKCARTLPTLFPPSTNRYREILVGDRLLVGNNRTDGRAECLELRKSHLVTWITFATRLKWR